VFSDFQQLTNNPSTNTRLLKGWNNNDQGKQAKGNFQLVTGVEAATSTEWRVEAAAGGCSKNNTSVDSISVRQTGQLESRRMQVRQMTQ
jgi:hypothetical protein